MCIHILILHRNSHYTFSYRRQNGQEGFVPANYVKEVEPLKTTKTIRQKEMVSVPVKIKRKRLEKRRGGRWSGPGAKRSVIGRRTGPG